MNISNYYWYFSASESIIKKLKIKKLPKFCDDVIEYALQQKEVLK